jgi:hypothetical protein
LTKVLYKHPKEVLAEYLAENYRGGHWDYHYNKEQKVYWSDQAERLKEYLDRNKVVKSWINT